MAFITAPTYRTYSLRDMMIRFRDLLDQLPLGEERYTGSTHARDFGGAETDPSRRSDRGYRPTYALKIM